MNEISWKQLAALFTVTRASAEMTVIPGELILYGPDRFWSILAAKLIVFILFLPAIFMALRFKGEGFLVPAIRRNKIFGTVLAILFMLSLTAVILETLINLQLYISDVIFDNMLFIIGVSVISIAAYYGALKGFSAISRCSIFALVMFAVLMVLIASTASDKADINYLYPSFIRDGEYFIRSMLAEISSCSEILIFTVFCGHVRSKPHNAVFLYLAASLVLLEGFTLLYNLILGPYLDHLEYPLYTISSMSDVVIFQRLDGIDSVVWVFCCIIKLALCLCAAHNIFTSFGSSPDKLRQNILLAVYAVVLIGIAYFLGTDKERYDTFESMAHTSLHILVAGTLIPLAVLTAGKKRASAKEGGKSEK